MIKYVFIDLDDTIFDFHKAEAIALTQMLLEFKITPSESIKKRYSEINKSQWELLEKKLKTREEILIDRFTIFFSEIGADIDSYKAKEIYENLLGNGHFFVDGAEQLLENLCGKYRLYLASNGTESVQKRRIALSGIQKYFDRIFISQAVGYDKPAKEFFEKCFSAIPDFSADEAIIIGDSLSSDIMGGINAGIRTCLFNPEKKENRSGIIPDFEVTNLSEIPTLLERI